MYHSSLPCWGLVSLGRGWIRGVRHLENTKCHQIKGGHQLHPALPFVMTNQSQMPHLQHCWEEPSFQWPHTAQGLSAAPSTWCCTPQTALPAWGAIRGLAERVPKTQTLTCRLNADTLCKQQTFCCRPQMSESTELSQGTGECLWLERSVQQLHGYMQTRSPNCGIPRKKGPNTHSPRLFQSFGEERASPTGISELSVIFHGSRDGSIITLVLWRCQNAPVDPTVVQYMNFNTACLLYQTLLLI